MEFKGSKTEQNLLAGFAGESMARNRYEFYAKRAEADGYQHIAEIFRETADNEQAHARLMFNYIHALGKTDENLKAAAYGEHEEWAEIYSKAAFIAKEEGFEEIAAFFETLCTVEAEHEKRFLALQNNVEKREVFKKESTQKWVCKNCGYVHEGPEAPDVCPLCKYPKSYFEIKSENY